jgi:fructan beta-fructosidase
MKYKIICLFLFLSQPIHGQAPNDIKERLRNRFTIPKNWHNVIMMEDLNIEADNGMTWRNESISYMIEIEFEANGANDLGVKVLLKSNSKQEAIVGYSLNNEQLYINNTNAGNAGLPDALGMFVTPMKIERGRIKLQIFVNKTSVEVFGNDGEAAVLSQVFPEENSFDWQIFSDGKAKVSKLSVWEQKD